MASEIETLEGKKQEDVLDVELDKEESKQVEEEAEDKESKDDEGSDGGDEAEENKGHSKRGRKDSEKKGNSGSKKVKTDASSKEPVTPVDRPTRERKTVERYTESMQRLSAPKPFSIEKGSGTQLKDIPNVAYKLSKRKADETLQSLHTVLYNKRAKMNTLKKNVGMFSGFVWVDDEQEKQRLKVKEKLDKCTKEKLFDFCDILNLQIHKSSLKKASNFSLKLLEFLQSPHATTEILLAEKEQKAKNKKAKARKSRTPSTKQSGEKRKRSSKVKEENSVDEDEGSESEDESKEEDEKSTPSKPDSDEEKEGGDDEEDKPENNEEKEKSEEGGDDEVKKSESDEEKDKYDKQVTSEKSSSAKTVKKDSGTKSGRKSKAVKKDDMESPAKSNKKSKKGGDTSAGTPGSTAKLKVSSSKKSKEENNSKKAEAKSSVKKDSAKDQGKGKTNKKAKADPTNEEMHAVVVSILKEVDFNTVSQTHDSSICTHFDQDLLHRKAEVKAIITDVINNMSGDEDEEEEDEEKEAKGGSDKGGDGDEGKLILVCTDDGAVFVEADANCNIQLKCDQTKPDTVTLDKLIYNIPGNVLKKPVRTGWFDRFDRLPLTNLVLSIDHASGLIRFYRYFRFQKNTKFQILSDFRLLSNRELDAFNTPMS
ncbi:hypothetical protein R6Q57_020856 [Mikania cordata]